MRTLTHVQGCDEHWEAWFERAMGFVIHWMLQYNALPTQEEKREFAEDSKRKFGSLYIGYLAKVESPGYRVALAEVVSATQRLQAHERWVEHVDVAQELRECRLAIAGHEAAIAKARAPTRERRRPCRGSSGNTEMVRGNWSGGWRAWGRRWQRSGSRRSGRSRRCTPFSRITDPGYSRPTAGHAHTYKSCHPNVSCEALRCHSELSLRIHSVHFFDFPRLPRAFLRDPLQCKHTPPHSREVTLLVEVHRFKKLALLHAQ